MIRERIRERERESERWGGKDENALRSMLREIYKREEEKGEMYIVVEGVTG